ncbi:MAG TPA: hypothetical protein VIN75_06165 [Burkholderiaceae bacterium]
MSRVDAARRALLRVAAATAVAGVAGCAAPGQPKEKRMSDDDMSFSRIGPPDVDPVEFEGRRYEQIINGQDEHLDQRTGYLAVTDVATGKRLAAVKVYAVAFDRDIEADVQDVFFVHLELQAAERRLLVENEHGQRFYVALDGYAVTAAP